MTNTNWACMRLKRSFNLGRLSLTATPAAPSSHQLTAVPPFPVQAWTISLHDSTSSEHKTLTIIGHSFSHSCVSMALSILPLTEAARLVQSCTLVVKTRQNFKKQMNGYHLPLVMFPFSLAWHALWCHVKLDQLRHEAAYIILAAVARIQAKKATFLGKSSRIIMLGNKITLLNHKTA